MAYLIDTSVFIALERGRQTHDALGELVGDEPIALAAITASELLLGIYRANSVERRLQREAFVERALDMVTVLPFDLREARVHAQVLAELLASGQKIGAHDLLVAATAIANGYTVLTDNVRDFHCVPGLVVRRPDW